MKFYEIEAWHRRHPHKTLKYYAKTNKSVTSEIFAEIVKELYDELIYTGYCDEIDICGYIEDVGTLEEFGKKYVEGCQWSYTELKFTEI